MLDDPADLTDSGVWISQGEECAEVASHVHVPHALQPLIKAAVSRGSNGRGQLAASEEELRLIGRWGEEVAFKVLSARQDVCDVVWMNATLEKGFPYDITLRLKDDAEEVYVEVKASSAPRQHTHSLSHSRANTGACHISLQELDFALVSVSGK